MITQKDLIIRLLFAFILGGLIGLERQIRNKHAGIRTHIILCMASAFLVISAIKFCTAFGTSEMGRIVLGVVISMGFLGAGVIYKEKEDQKVIIRGLTTSATLLITAVIGMAVGMGYLFESVVTTVLVLIALVLVRIIEIKTKLKSFKENK